MLTLIEIARSGRLLGGDGYIKGGHRCICFTEAPLPPLASSLLASNSFSRYMPFGVMLPKRWIFAQGGRPVVYGHDSEYEQLPPPIRWRHVRYEPDSDPPIDFTWEREWRIQCETLEVSAAEAALVLPDFEWFGYFQTAWHAENQIELESYAAILDHLVLQQLEEPFPWRLVALAE